MQCLTNLKHDKHKYFLSIIIHIEVYNDILQDKVIMLKPYMFLDECNPYVELTCMQHMYITAGVFQFRLNNNKSTVVAMLTQCADLCVYAYH